MNKNQSRLQTFLHSLAAISGVKLFLLFIGAIVFYALYFTFVIPQHFMFAPSVIAQEISLKELKLNSELRVVIASTIHKYASGYLLRVEDGAEVYSYTLGSAEQNTLVHARIIPDTVWVQNASVNNGLIEFELRLPAIDIIQQQVQLRPLLSCSFLISEVRKTDSQNDLIQCLHPKNGRLTTLTQADFFDQGQVNERDPAQIVFSDLHTLMPLARNLVLNRAGHFGQELTNLESMLLLSTAVITTSGTLGIEPASRHARVMVAAESISGIFIMLWFFAVRLRQPR